MTAGPAPRPVGDGDRPPVGGSWAVLYAVVIANLTLLVALFSVLARAFR